MIDYDILKSFEGKKVKVEIKNYNDLDNNLFVTGIIELRINHVMGFDFIQCLIGDQASVDSLDIMNIEPISS